MGSPLVTYSFFSKGFPLFLKHRGNNPLPVINTNIQKTNTDLVLFLLVFLEGYNANNFSKMVYIERRVFR